MNSDSIRISQTVAILVDGNNIERSLHKLTSHEGVMLNFDLIVPRLIENRA